MKQLTYRTHAKHISQFLYDNKASDITILNVKDVCDFTDFFVFATARSSTHVSALLGHLKKEFKKHDLMPTHREGLFRDTQWVVVDYINIVVHVFTQEVRDHYQIEDLWSKGKVVAWKKKVSKSDKKQS